MDTSGSDTAATLTSVTGSGDERDDGTTISVDRPIHPYVHVVIVAIISAGPCSPGCGSSRPSTGCLENDFVTANRWMFR